MQFKKRAVMSYVNSEGRDQPAYPQSDRAFFVCCDLLCTVVIDSVGKQRRPYNNKTRKMPNGIMDRFFKKFNQR